MIKVRLMSDEERRLTSSGLITGTIAENYEANTHERRRTGTLTVESDEVFGGLPYAKGQKDIIDMSEFRKVGHIELGLRFMNYFAAGPALSMVTALTGLKKKTVESILSCAIVYDKEKDTYFNTVSSVDSKVAEKEEMQKDVEEEEEVYYSTELEEDDDYDEDEDMDLYVSSRRSEKERELVGIYDGTGKYSFEVSKLSNASSSHHIRYVPGKILIGGELIDYLLNSIDYKERFKILLLNNVVKSVPRNLASFVYDNGEPGYRLNLADVELYGELLDYEQTNSVYVYDKYWFRFHEEIPADVLVLLQGSMDYQMKKELLQLYSAVKIYQSVIERLEEDSNFLRNYTMETILVPPIGIRPRIDQRADPLTKVYNNIVRKTMDLKTLLQNAEGTPIMVTDIRRQYIILDKQLKSLFTVPADGNRVASLEARLTGKKSLIRGKLLKAIIDKAGRTVITSDPKMPIGYMGIPEKMLVSLFEDDIVRGYKPHKNATKVEILKSTDAMEKDRLRRAIKIAEQSLVLCGRQPTLYYLGLQAFRIVPVKGNCIVLNPLSCTAYNADFDGDQMYVATAANKKSYQELWHLCNSVKNPYFPKDGKIHLNLKNEMVYGIHNIFTTTPREDIKPINAELTAAGEATFLVYDSMYKSIVNEHLDIRTPVNIGGNIVTAGEVAFRHCLTSAYGNIIIGEVPIVVGLDSQVKVSRAVDTKINTNKYLQELVSYIEQDTRKTSGFKTIKGVLDKLVVLGFEAAEQYPPSVTLPEEIIGKDAYVKEYEDKVNTFDELYQYGIITDSALKYEVDKAYSELNKNLTRLMEEQLSETGYMQMAVSGARGSKSNVMQTLVLKGRVQKNKAESFTAIVKNSYSKGLNETEHSMTAYGGRQGQLDKVIATYAPGYQMRKMSFTAAHITINSRDCGTKNGILIEFDKMLDYSVGLKYRVEAEQNSREGDTIAVRKFERIKAYKEVFEYVKGIVLGRYVILPAGNSEFVDTDDKFLFLFESYIATYSPTEVVVKEGIKLRSALYCEDTLCVKCYGTNLSTQRMSVPGLAVGAVASQSIGEPGTQMTMKNFQAGGIVSSSKNLTSSFDMINRLLHVKNLNVPNEPVEYDYISTHEGYIRKEPVKKGISKLVHYKMEDGQVKDIKGTPNIFVYSDVALKHYVKRGESIQKYSGNKNIPELLDRCDADYAVEYLLFNLYDLYRDEVFVNLKHFEQIVAGMTFMVAKRSMPLDNVSAGDYLTLKEYNNISKKNPDDFIKTVVSVKGAPQRRRDVLASSFMEDFRDGMSLGILQSGLDMMDDPVIRTGFGLKIKHGTSVDGYLEGR